MSAVFVEKDEESDFLYRYESEHQGVGKVRPEVVSNVESESSGVHSVLRFFKVRDENSSHT